VLLGGRHRTELARQRHHRLVPLLSRPAQALEDDGGAAESTTGIAYWLLHQQ
jgi:hypothetical protein